MFALHQLTDSQLVAIYQKNQAPVYYGELYNRYYTKVYHFCLGKVKNRDDAYDITSDTFVKLATKIIGLRNPELFIAWLFRMASNACIDSLKAKKRILHPEDQSYFDATEATDEMADKILKEQQLDAMDVVLNQLDHDTKLLLVSKYIMGKSIDDLQRELGLSKSAVKMRLARGRNRVAEMM